jgi:hypothetical protein
MTKRTAEPRPFQGFVLLWVGVMLLLVYGLLGSLHVGKFGQPADIGGGFIPLAGFILVAWGLISLIRSLVAYGRRQLATRKQRSVPGGGIGGQQT